MRSMVIICDRCGKDISPDKRMYSKISHIGFTLEYWHGGSMGGEEDRDRYDLDLCEDCSRDLARVMDGWLKEK